MEQVKHDPELANFSPGLRKSMPVFYEDAEKRRKRRWTWAGFLFVLLSGYVALGVTIGWGGH